MNISQIIHEKVYRIGINKTTDVGSGVSELHIYAQASDLGNETDADFSNASIVGKLLNVDNIPSYSDSGNSNNVLGLRNIYSELITGTVTNSDRTPKHNSQNIYVFEFNNYVNGKYYYFWVLASDKAGNLELLNSSGVNSLNVPLKKSSFKLVDDIAPEFDDIEQLNDLVWNATSSIFEMSVPSGWTVTSQAQARAYLQNRIIIFTQSGVSKTRYAEDVNYVNSKITFSVDTTGISGVSADSNSTKLLPLVTVNGGVGYLELSYGLSNSVNLSSYKIERAVGNISTEPSLSDNLMKEGDLPLSANWELVGYINAEKYIDRGLVLSKASIETPGTAKKFLYKVSPLSVWANSTGSEILGQPIYTTKLNFNSTNYRPSAGSIPNTITNASQVSLNNGAIQIEFDEIIDSNGDLKGYEIQRLRSVNLVDEPYITILIAEASLIESGSILNKKHIDFNLEPYNPNIIEYKYRIRAIDWGGNVGNWYQFSEYVKSTDSQIPTVGNSGISAVGKIGGWKGRISGIDADVVAVDIWAKYAVLSADVDSAAGTYIGRFGIQEGQTALDFTYLNASSNVKTYAKFAWVLIDKYNNDSLHSGYNPATAVVSETPQAVIDEFAPSVIGFTATPQEIPNVTDETDIAVSSIVDNDTFVISGAIGVKADELVGKQITNATSGETRLISANGATASNLTSIQLSSAFTNLTVGDILSISPFHVRITINKQDSVTGTITSVPTTTFDQMVDNTKAWTVDQWKGWDLYINSVNVQIKSNDATTIVLKEPLEFNPNGMAYTIQMPEDLGGFMIFRGKVTAGVVESWVQIADTKSPYESSDIFDIVDRTVENGTYKYGVTAYDLNGNESSIKESTNSVDLTDIAAPGIPKVKGVLGTSGQLLLYWNRTASDVEYYELAIQDSAGKYVLADDGSFIASASRNTIAKKEQVLSEQFTLYGVTDSKTSILAYKYKVIAYDKSGNALTGHSFEALSSSIVYLNDYYPASGVAPNNPTGFTLTKDDNGKVVLTIPIANLNNQIANIIIQRRVNSKYTNNGVDSWTEFATISIIGGIELDVNGEILNQLVYTDPLNDRVIAGYKLKAVGHNGIANDNFTAEVSIEVVDFIGYDLQNAILDLSLSIDIGKIWFKFKDVIDKNNAKYEIWRTNDVVTDWSTGGIFTNGNVQPKVLHSNWEKIAILSSTLLNNVQEDYLEYTDNDWQPNGTIDVEDTILLTPYNRKAVYCLIAVDEWGNRGSAYFLPSGVYGANSIIYVPYEPRANRIEKDALYCDFNKGVQLNRGDVPINNPEAVLYKGKGIEVLGDLKYNLDKLNGDYSVVIRRLQKQFTDINLASLVDLFLYDTASDNTDYSSVNFPKVALFVASSTNVKLYDYETMVLIDTYTPAVTSGTISKIFFINGKLYVGTSSTTISQNYIKDYTTNAVSQLHNLTALVNDIFVSEHSSVLYEVVCTNTELYINNSTNTIKSTEKGIFTKAIILKGFIYAHKDGTIYKSKLNLNSIDFSVSEVEISLFNIFTNLESAFINVGTDDKYLLIAESKLLTIVDDRDRVLKIGGGINTQIPFSGGGLLCGVFEQIINLLLSTENNEIILTEDNRAILI